MESIAKPLVKLALANGTRLFSIAHDQKFRTDLDFSGSIEYCMYIPLRPALIDSNSIRVALSVTVYLLAQKLTIALNGY